MNKNETRNSVRAKLQLMVSFAKAIATLKELIVNSFEDSVDGRLFELLEKIQSYEITNVDNIMAELGTYFKVSNVCEGNPLAVPYLELRSSIYPIETGIQYPNGERLATFIAEGESETFQAGSIFYTADETLVDLAMAEIKRGDIAGAYQLPKDNKDIDIYVWSNVNKEDYIHTFHIQHDDILKAIEEEQEGGESNE